jgi:WD40 repeat protein
MAFSPDSKLIATAHPFGRVRLWDTASGKMTRTVSTSGVDLAGLLFMPDGKCLLTRTARTISALEVATGKKLFPWEGHHDSVNFLNFSGDDRRLVTVTGIGRDSIRYPSEVITWERATWRPSARSTNETLDLEESLAISLDNTLAAHDSEEGRVTLTDVATKKPLRLFEGSYKNILHEFGRFSPNHRVLMLSTREKDKFEHLFFEVGSGKYLGRIPGSEHPLVFSPDDRLVAWFDVNDQRLYVAEVAGGKRRAMDWAPKKELFDVHTPALVFSPEGDFLATWDYKGSDVFIWRVATGKEVLRIPSANINRITLAWSPTGRMLAGGRGTDKGDTIDLVEASTGLVRRTLPGHRANLASLAFSNDGRLLVSGSVDTTALVWDVYGSTGKATRDLTTDSLGGNNATESQAAIASLIQRPDKAVSLLREKLVPAVKPKPEHVKQLWADLDNEDFTVRAQAVRSLSEMGDMAAPLLKELLAGKHSAEQRRLGEESLKAVQDEQPTSPVVLRSLRSIEALEVIGTPDARALLETLAKGAEESRQTREAKSALKRLARREAKP